jgi:hypothetical protein
MNAARLARKWDEAGNSRLAMAEALADELGADLVTKADLGTAVAELRAAIANLAGELRTETATGAGGLRAEIAAVEGRLRGEIQGTKAELIKWLAGLMIGQALGVVALVRLFS